MSTTAPKGYQDQSTDVAGFWNPDLAPAIHFIPFGVKLLDANLATKKAPKASYIILGRLVDGAMLQTKEGEEQVPVEGMPGDIVGIWWKPGMKAVLHHTGHKVWMTPNGEKDVGQPSPMKLFQVLSPDSPRTDLIPILEDNRDVSASLPTPFDVRRGARTAPVSDTNGDTDAEDDVPATF
jgi:hypothetical protein